MVRFLGSFPGQRLMTLLALCAMSLALQFGCGSSTRVDGGDGDADGDSDGDADGDSDGDADGDSDGDADGDSDGDADGDADGDGDGDVSCEPARAAESTCETCTEAEDFGWFWDGFGCYQVVGCGCQGEGCERSWGSEEECLRQHSSCDSALCLETGGRWFTDSECGPCGHFTCGFPSGDDCCSAGCDCGVGMSFEEGVGCVFDASCTEEMACVATGGAWYPSSECICGFTCGEPNDCRACVDSCDCGAFRTYDSELGCVFDDACEDPDERELCEATAGYWHEGEGCGHFLCGVPNYIDPCVSPGCDCGPTGQFDSDMGCLYDATCLNAGLGQDCHGFGASSNCRPGLVCCSSCGMAPGCNTCELPCCADDATCEENGCPIPPP